MIFPWFVYLLQNKKRAWFSMCVAIVMHILVVRYFLTEKFVLPSAMGDARHNIVFSSPFLMLGGLIYLYRKPLSNEKLKYVWLILATIATILQITIAPKLFGENVLFLLLLFSLWMLYAMTGGIHLGFNLLNNKVTKFIGSISMENIYVTW